MMPHENESSVRIALLPGTTRKERFSHRPAGTPANFTQCKRVFSRCLAKRANVALIATRSWRVLWRRASRGLAEHIAARSGMRPR